MQARRWRLKKFGRVYARLADVRGMSAQGVRSQVAHARRLAAQGRLTPALRLLREAGWALVRRGAIGEGAATLRQVGRLLLLRGQAAEALQLFRDIIALPTQRIACDPTEGWVMWAMVDAGHWEEADSAFRRMQAARPADSLSRWLDAGRARLALL